MGIGPLAVSAALIMKDGKVLLSRRPEGCQSAPSLWEFPGGKIEFGERPEEALCREIREELGVDIVVGQIFDVSSHIYPEGEGRGKHVLLLVYKASIPLGEPEPLGCPQVGWFPIDGMPMEKLCPADKAIARRLRDMEG